MRNAIHWAGRIAILMKSVTRLFPKKTIHTFSAPKPIFTSEARKNNSYPRRLNRTIQHPETNHRPSMGSKYLKDMAIF